MGLLNRITGGVEYRIRIFDNFHHVKTVTVKDKGQRSVKVTVDAKWFGFGEKTKLEFMINPDIKPFIFGGSTFELNYDIRDAVPMADLLDIDPKLVIEIDKTYKTLLDLQNQKKPAEDDYVKTGHETDPGVINAEFTEVKEDTLAPDDPLLDPVQQDPEPVIDKRHIDTVIRGAKEAYSIADAVIKLKYADELTQEERLDRVMGLCRKHPKLLYWLPKRLDLGSQVKAIVSQSMIYRVSVMPSYYIAQSGAMISEKTLTKPKEKKGWEDVAVIGIIVIGIIVTVWILMHGGI